MILKTLVLFTLHIVLSSAHYDPAYFRSSEDQFDYYKDWMKDISDDMLLSELALPGTHDSGTFTTDNAIATTQSIDFKQQLEYGIRVFDIRFRHITNRFALHHGPIFLNIMFENFLENVDLFLNQHPTEVVLFRMSKERFDGDGNNRSMVETLEYYLSLYPDKYKKVTENIQLKDARGKFIIISYVEEFHSYGLNRNLFDIQDQYELRSVYDLYDKWLAIRSHLHKSVQGNQYRFYTNYLSGSGGVFPYFVVSGHLTSGTSAPRLLTGLTTPTFANSYPDFPRVECFDGICAIAFEGTNILTRDYIKSNTCTNRTVGIVISDFPGTSLIAEVIQNNFNYKSCNGL